MASYTPKSYIAVGQILKPFGKQGVFLCAWKDFFDLDYFDTNHHLFLKKYGTYVPVFLDMNYCEVSEGQLKLEHLSNPEQVKYFNRQELYVDQMDIPDVAGSQLFESLENYDLYHQDQFIGKIVEVQITEFQVLASVDYGDKTILIPIHEDMVIDLDPSGKRIVMDLPEGLLEL